MIIILCFSSYLQHKKSYVSLGALYVSYLYKHFAHFDFILFHGRFDVIVLTLKLRLSIVNCLLMQNESK